MNTLTDRENPEAELIAACNAWLALEIKLLDASRVDDEGTERWDEKLETSINKQQMPLFERIVTLRPRTDFGSLSQLLVIRTIECRAKRMLARKVPRSGRSARRHRVK